MTENLDDKLKQIEALQASAAQKSVDVNSALADVQAGIKNKTYTSGDVVKDFMISSSGLNPDAKIEQKLRTLQKTIGENQQKQVLIVSREQSYHGTKGCFGGGFSHINGGNDLLGIIGGQLSFDYENQQFVIPVVEKYVMRESPDGKWAAENGNVKIHVLDLQKLDEWSQRSFVSEVFYWFDCGSCGGHENPSHQLRILTGKEVELFFKLQEEHYVWGSYGAPLLDRIRKDPSKEISNELFQIFGRVDTSYVTALQLLETEASKEFKKLHAEQIAKRKEAIQKDILANLDTVLRGQETAHRYSLTKTLQEAVELGMHKDDKILADYKGVPGLSLNVQKYIVDTCQKQGIKTE